jgi:hypothetical protein
MSQHDFNIANQSFPATRTDLNNALAALASNSSGDAEPGTTYSNQWWYETDTNTLKLRNEANNAWIEIATLDQSNNNVLSITTQGLTLGATVITASGADINLLDSLTRGSIIYGNNSGVTSELVKGGAGTVLTSDGTDISWAAAGGGGGGMEFIASSGAISNAANVSFTQFDSSKYDHYQFWFQYVIPESDNTYLRGVVSSDGGSSYDGGGSNYHYDGITDANAFIVARLVGNDTNENGIAGTFYLYAPHNTGYTYAQPSMVLTESNGDILGPDYNRTHGNGQVHLVAADVDAIRFQFSSGNIASGEITMFGIVNS